MKMKTTKLALLLSVLSISAMPAYSGEAPQNLEAVNASMKQARANVLRDRPYKLNRYERVGGVELSIAPIALGTEEKPDWWSEKQGYDLARLLEIAMGHYPGVTVAPGTTWEAKTLQQELGTTQQSGNISLKPKLLRKEAERRVTLRPVLTNYQFQAFKPKKRGLGLFFIAITSKSCKTENFVAFRSDLEDSDPSQAAGYTQGLANDFDVTKLIITETGGTSLNMNALVAGAGGGDFTPPERATKELLYEAIVDIAEGTYCILSQNKECIAYYMQRKQLKPTPPARDKKGKIIKLKPEDTKC